MEKTVALLEKALTPGSEVRHNELLPVLGDPKSTRQCDVTIRTGQPPRQTLTIVEVQKRDAKPELVMFHGWYAKMREVGAQHLICVSEAGFPHSIIQRVFREFGPTVRLMTLADLENPEIPGLHSLSSDIFRHRPQFSVELFESTVIGSGQVPIEANFDATSRFLDRGNGREALSLNEALPPILLRRERALAIPSHLLPNPEVVELDLLAELGPDLWVNVPQGRFKLKASSVRVKIDHQWERIPLRFSEYRQVETGGVVAWLESATGECADGTFSYEMVFTLNATNSLQMMFRSTDPGLCLTVSPDKDLLAKAFAPLEKYAYPAKN